MSGAKACPLAAAMMLALFSPACHRSKPQPPPAPPPPLVNPAPPPARNPEEARPVPPEIPPQTLGVQPPLLEPLQVPPPPRRRPRPSAPAAETPPAPPPPPLPQLEQILTQQQQKAYNDEIDRNIARARQTLAALAGHRLNEEQRTYLERIRAFLAQAEEARKSDLFRARNLAERASLLADDLLRSVQ